MSSVGAKNSLSFVVQPGGQLNGDVRVPGDKSISHRSIMLGAIAQGETTVEGFLQGADSLATLNAFRAMGVQISDPLNGQVTIQGVGLKGLRASAEPLDLGNSGTSMRLLSGLLCPQIFSSTLIGDSSLMSRPMKRVTEPLTLMGAKIGTTELGTAPLRIEGGRTIHPVRYDLPVASAQVKSALLLAGLYASGETILREPGITRDHTERMLRAFGYEVRTEGDRISLEGGGQLIGTHISIPADISSATFFMVGAAIAKGSDVTLLNVGINPTRTGVIDILRLMGANIECLNERMMGGEPVADIRVRASDLKGIDIPEHLVPLAIDEFPALFIAAACADGVTRLTGAEELRVKESDRIQVMADGLIAAGIEAQATPDGMIINGGDLQGASIHSHGDHRIAMSFAIAALRSSGVMHIHDCKNVDTSFPQFVELSQQIGLQISVECP